MPANGSDAGTVQEIDETLSRIFLRRDTDLADRLISEDFVAITPSGVVGGKDLEMRIVERGGSGGTPVEEIDVDEVVVRVHGDSALVVSRFTYKLEGEEPKQNRSCRAYVKRDGRWLAAMAQSTPIAG